MKWLQGDGVYLKEHGTNNHLKDNMNRSSNYNSELGLDGQHILQLQLVDFMLGVWKRTFKDIS